MKFTKSNFTSVIDKLPKGKARLTVNGTEPENIWVARDEDNKVMYLLNHALAFFPLPSWGSEWPIGGSIDVAEARGKTFEDGKLTLHPEAFDFLQSKGLIKEDGELDIDKWNEWNDSPGESEDEEKKEIDIN